MFRHYLPQLLGLGNLRACCGPWTW